MRSLALPLVAMALTAACAPAGEMDDGSASPSGPCNADAAQSWLGTIYTDDIGAQLLELTGASILRATHKDNPVTMDYRPERLTIAYDDDKAIVRLICG